MGYAIEPGQSLAILLVLVVLAFSPLFLRWAYRADGEDLQQEQDADLLPEVMTPVQALARHLYGEAYGWGTMDMLNYDHTPWVREPWERSAIAQLQNRATVNPAYPPEATPNG